MNEDTQYKFAALAIVAPWLFIGLIVFIGIIKGCVGTGIDPMDDSVMRSREVVDHILVRDSTHNGFRVVFATKISVTSERLQEIRSRKYIKMAFKQIQHEAPIFFNHNLLYTDIYDFSEYILNFKIDPDIVVHNIFVSGIKKCNLYVQPNPNIKNCATYFDNRTEQGAQYLSYADINFYTKGNKKKYRYWKCYGLYSFSDEDEQFSHFSKDEKIE